nr:ATP-binding cassette domain-containing protein [uncultured Butyrivibrio sp.]
MDKYIGFIKDGKNQREYLKWIVKLTAKSKKPLVRLFILNTCVAAAAVLVSLVNKSIVDQAGDRVVFHTLVIIMVLLQLFSILGGLVETLLESVITEKYACQVRKSLFEHLLKLPWLSRSVYHSEELLSRITSDVEQITSGVSRLVISGGAKMKCGVRSRKLISYVPQGNTLMFGTIADNLRMGKSDATIDKMKEVLRIADALDFVESLPDGIDTRIGEKATGISEGQAQRISIARALLKKSAILILDEATSALDEKTKVNKRILANNKEMLKRYIYNR